MMPATISRTSCDKESDSRPYFDKEMTNVVKGIALIIMFIHHFFTFPYWWVSSVSYPYFEKLWPYLQPPTRLCVPIFCFLTGYFYYFTREKTFRYSFKKISDLLVSYWFIYIPLALFASIVMDYKYTPMLFLQELFAFNTPTMIFCWYVNFYCLFMLIMPLIVKVITNSIHVNLFITIILTPTLFHLIGMLIGKYSIILHDAFKSIYFCLPNVLVGYLFAKHSIFRQIESCCINQIHNKTTHIILAICAIIFIPLGRYIEPSMTIVLHKLPLFNENISFYICFDVLYAPFFIYFFIYVIKTINIGYLRHGLSIIGKNSVLMWFIHCLFFANSKTIFQPLLYFPKNPILVLLWGIVICLAISFVCNKLITKINDKKNKLFFS